MRFQSIILVVGLAAIANPARAAVTFEYLLDGGYVTAVSSDGNVVAGNTSSAYEAFRWTRTGGFVDLGYGSAPVVGNTGGTPGMSFDGTRVASTIVNSDSTYSTSGLWVLGQGWQQIAPPVPPLGGVMDASLSDVWGMSGDGRAVVGLFWRPGQYQASAHAYRWTAEQGMVDLGATAHSSRPNGASYDGSVIAGWDEHPDYGYRRPCAWRGTTLYPLGDYDALGEATTVSPNGEWIVGFELNPATNIREAARWHWDGSAWSATQFLGSVPGSFPGYGLAAAKGVSADGRLVIGYESFYGDPTYTTGFIWTDSTGCMDINFWLADQGVDLDPNFTIQSLSVMTPDGLTLTGYGRATTMPYTVRSFEIHLDRAVTAVGPGAAGRALRLLASPNPARRGTAFAFDLPAAGRVALSVHDAAGRLVRRVTEDEYSAGSHRVAWDGRDDSGSPVAPGVYLTRLEGPGGVHASGKLVVLE